MSKLDKLNIVGYFESVLSGLGEQQANVWCDLSIALKIRENLALILKWLLAAYCI